MTNQTMKKNITFLIVLLVGLYSYAQEEIKIYEDKDYEIKYPSNWTLETETGTEATFAIKAPLSSDKDSFVENVNLITQDLKGMGITLDKYVKYNESQIKTISNGELFYSKKDTRDGREYHTLVFKGTINNLELKARQLYSVKNEMGYVLTFTTLENEYEDLEEIGKEIIDTFKLKK